MAQYESYNRFPELLVNVDRALREEVVEAAFSLRFKARLQPPSPINPGPYATGATMAGLYIVTAAGNDFAERYADALRLGGAAIKKYKLDPLNYRKPPAYVYRTYVATSLEYDYFVHNGFYHVRAKRYIAGQPFLYRAAAEERPDHIERLKDKLSRAVRLR